MIVSTITNIAGCSLWILSVYVQEGTQENYRQWGKKTHLSERPCRLVCASGSLLTLTMWYRRRANCMNTSNTGGLGNAVAAFSVPTPCFKVRGQSLHILTCTMYMFYYTMCCMLRTSINHAFSFSQHMLYTLLYPDHHCSSSWYCCKGDRVSFTSIRLYWICYGNGIYSVWSHPIWWDIHHSMLSDDTNTCTSFHCWLFSFIKSTPKISM